MNCPHDGNQQQTEFIEHGCIYCWKECSEKLSASLDKAETENIGYGYAIQTLRYNMGLDNTSTDVSECLAKWEAEKAAREKAEAAAGEMREALDELMLKACEFIAPDEDGHPECACCGMCLHDNLDGHKSDCLAKAIQDQGHALSSDCGKDFVPRAELEKAQAAIQATKDEMFGRFLQWRGIDREEDACKQCRGAGVFMYGSTAMWRGGIGGQMMTMGMCSKCWGSGQESRPWLSPADAAKLREHANALELSNSQQAVEVIRLTEDNKRLREALDYYASLYGGVGHIAKEALKGDAK